MRCMREDVATDSLAEVLVTIYWGPHGCHRDTPTLGVGDQEAKMTKWSKVAHMAVQPITTPNINVVVSHGVGDSM